MSPQTSFLRAFGRDTQGGTAIELGLALPVFGMLLFGAIDASQLVGAISGMHYAVEEAARCSAVNSTLCGTTTASNTYAQGRYQGPSIAPAFTTTTTTCGKQVNATATFHLNIAVAILDVPLSAQACYPASGA